MSKKERITLLPKLRFSEFQDEWKKESLSMYLKESRVKGSTGNIAKKLTVKLWGKGVFEKHEAVLGSESTQYYYRRKGQFIYSKLDFLNQAFGIVPEHLDGYESTVDLPCFDISENLNSKFLLEYIQRPTFYKHFGEIADGGRKAKRIQTETFLNFPIVLSNFREQQKIANCLSSFDDLIVAEDKKLSALRKHKKGLMQKLFPAEGKTVPEWRFPEFMDGGDWEINELGNVGDIVTGKTPDTSDKTLWNGDIQFVTPTDITEDKYQFNTQRTVVENSKIKVIPANSIMFTCIASVGKMAISVYPCITNQQINTLIPYESYCNECIYYALLKKSSVIKSTLANSTLPIINKTEFSKITIAMSRNLLEQQKIADCLSELDKLITAQSGKIEALKAHKKGLMQGLFPSIEEVAQ